MNTVNKKRSPWSWIPTLYFAEGLPYVAVMTISVIMYKRMGISNTDIALYTSWLYLPWVIKPFWSPFVDLLKTKRWWIVVMQLLIGAGFAGIAFSIPVPFYFQATLAFFWLLAFSSATHDIAADGFYMLALDTNQQAMFVGIRSTFYRVATVMGQGILIILAGFLESTSGLEPLQLNVDVSPEYTSELIIPDIVNTVPQQGDLFFFTDVEALQVSTQTLNKDSAQAFISAMAAINSQHGFVSIEEKGTNAATDEKVSWWTSSVSRPFGNWVRNTFGEEVDNIVVSDYSGNLAIATIRLSKQPEEDKEVVLNTAFDNGDRSVTLVHGERLVFNATNWDKPAFMIFQIDPKLKIASSANFRGLSGDIPFAWSITFFVLAGLFICFSIWHRLFLPKPAIDKANSNVTAKSILSEFGHTFKTFFQKPQAGVAIFFMLTYRFSEAQLIKLINPFLLDSKDVGGLGLTTGEVGFVYGTIGIIGLTMGGIIGGLVAARGGLKKWLWPMTLSMLLTCFSYVFLSYTQTESLIWINIAIFIDQFGYGFGFTAYMLYLMYYADGEHKTAHYAICTGFMALGMMIPGMFAGWLEELIGYKHFFVWVMICSIVPIIAAALLKIDPNYGKKAVSDKK